MHFEKLNILTKLSFIKNVLYPPLGSYTYEGRTLEEILWTDLNPDIYTNEERMFFIQTIGRFPSLPIIIDKCKNHDERRVILKGLPRKVREALKINKLRRNVCLQVLSAVDLLEQYNSNVWKKYKKRNLKFSNAMLSYQTLSDDQKIVFVNDLSVFAKQVCLSLCTSC